MPPGLAELELLHMEMNSEHSRHLFIPQLHNSLALQEAGPSGLAELRIEQLHEGSNSERNRQLHPLKLSMIMLVSTYVVMKVTRTHAVHVRHDADT